jgi:WD40 repeat protein
MILHPSLRSDEFAQKFAEASEYWNLDKLYQDIANAKNRERQKIRKQLTPTEKACLRGLLCDRTPTEIACELNREPTGLRVELSRGLYRYIENLTDLPIKSWSNVSKQLEKAGYKLHKNSTDATNQITTIQNPKSKIQNRIDWGEAIDVSIFYGRTNELAKLQQWIERDKCRLVALLGMGGIGKTALSVKLAQLVQEGFEFVVWHSLRDSTPIAKLLDKLIKFFSCHQETNLLETVGDKLSQLIEYLRNYRCLLVLDNFDALFSSGERAGNYRDGYEEYGELLKRLGEIQHQSCLVLTSREKPAEVAALAGEFLPVRSLQLSGLNNHDAQGILAAKGLSGSVDDTEKLIECYRGNPLALKIAATSILDLFDGSIAAFLQEETTVFNGVRNLLDRQFQRLSPLEEEVMYWTCINREPVKVSDLQSDIVPAVSKASLLESLESLTWRSLIEKGKDVSQRVLLCIPTTFTQQPVVMEYVTDKLVESVSEEVKTGEIDLLNKYALIKATAKDYVRESQTRVILKPILNDLKNNLKFESVIEQKLQTIIDSLPNNSTKSGYCAGNTINLLRHLKVDLTGYNFSNLTIWQADLQGANLNNCNFTNAKIDKSIFSQALPNILSVEFSPDGKFLATGDANGDLCLWNVEEEMQHIASLQSHVGWVWAVKFSSNSKTLASCGEDGKIGLWNVSTGKCLHIIEAHSMGCGSVSFSPNGKILASGGADETIKFWNVSSGQCVKVLKGHTKILRVVVFSPDGAILASGSDDCTIKLWDVESGECLHTLQGHTHAVLSAVFHPNGQTLATGSGDKTVKFWDVNTGECWRTLQGNHFETVVSVAFSPNGETLAAAGEASAISLWDVTTGNCIQTFGEYTRRIWSVAFSPQGNILASVGRDQTIRLWQVNTGKCLKTLQGYTGRVWAVAFSPDGQYLASGTDQTVQLWNTFNRENPKILHGHTCEVSTLIFTEQGQTLASASYDRTIRIWEVGTAQCLRTLRGHTGFIFSLTCSPDGKTLASGSADNTIKIWDVKTGQCLNSLEAHTNWVLSVAWSPHGQILASSSSDGTVKLWDTKTGECLETLQGHQSWVYSVAFSPDNQTVVSGGADLAIRLWDIKTGKCQQILPGHTNVVTGVKFSLDGDIIASCSRDRTIKLWDRYTGECLKTLSGHQHWVLGIAFHPNERILASASQDQTIRLWDILAGECQEILRSPRPYEGMNITGISGLSTPQKDTLTALGAIYFH